MKNVIYKIENLLNHKQYIGSTKDFLSRKRNHLNLLRKNKHHSKYLQRAYNKYGEKTFSFSILEYCAKSVNILQREQQFIDLMLPHYNLCKVAGSRFGVKASFATIEKLKIAHKGQKVSDLEKERRRKNWIGNKIGIGNRNKRKVTKPIVKKVEKLRLSGLGCRKIAKIMDLNKTTILNIFNKKFDYGRD